MAKMLGMFTWNIVATSIRNVLFQFITEPERSLEKVVHACDNSLNCFQNKYLFNNKTSVL